MGLELGDVLRRLVRVPSPTGREGNLAPLVAELMARAGLEVSLQPVDRRRSNVVGRMGSGSRLVFCTHLDTVSAGSPRAWRHPPLAGDVENGVLFGLGACDAKGQLAALLGAAERLADRPPCEVVVAAVVEEETGRALGTQRFLGCEMPQAAVVCEPTGLAVCTAHKGAIRPEITVRGEAAHASAPGSGENAIYRMVEAVRALERYGLSVASRTDPLLGNPSFTITMIRGGEQPNIVPQKCTIMVDRRLVSSESTAGALAELRAQLETIARDHDLRLQARITSQYPPTSTPRDHPLVRACLAAQRRALGRDEVGVFPAGCDMWAFRERGVPTVVVGPGRLEDTHRADERMPLAELELGARLYAAIAREWAKPAAR